MNDQPPVDVGLTPDNFPSVEEQPLSPIELEAKDHWERFLPSLAQELKQQGPDALDTAIRKAYWQMEYLTAVDRLKNPDLHDLQAQEAHRTVLFPPPESTDRPETDPLTIS